MSADDASLEPCDLIAGSTAASNVAVLVFILMGLSDTIIEKRVFFQSFRQPWVLGARRMGQMR